MMPPILIRLASNYLAGPLSQSVNNSIKKDCFPKTQRLSQLLPWIRKQMAKTLY